MTKDHMAQCLEEVLRNPKDIQPKTRTFLETNLGPETTRQVIEETEKHSRSALQLRYSEKREQFELPPGLIAHEDIREGIKQLTKLYNGIIRKAYNNLPN